MERFVRNGPHKLDRRELGPTPVGETFATTDAERADNWFISCNNEMDPMPSTAVDKTEITGMPDFDWDDDPWGEDTIVDGELPWGVEADFEPTRVIVAKGLPKDR
jgi:hypothetical protein